MKTALFLVSSTPLPPAPPARTKPLRRGQGPACQQSRFPKTERGIALVVTLLMLAVITFMAVTFLVLSQRQRDTVSTSTEQAVARRAADTGAQRALVESMATIKAAVNQFAFDLRVSTNYINPNGFISGLASYTNVSYAYPNGAPVTGKDFLQNLTHLLYSPRPPVYVNGDFRYYLDLNRNGFYDTNGVLYHNVAGRPAPVSMGFWVGDPEWIGILERPEYPHSSSNQFVSRFAYIVLPASKTLDLNLIHNYAMANLNDTTLIPGMAFDGFARDQGVGPWEMNLAAFLVDLNPNVWPYPDDLMVGGRQHQRYAYYPVREMPPASANKGEAFDNAVGLLRYRYSTAGVPRYMNLQPVLSVFGQAGLREFASDGFDDFGSGPIMTTNSTFWPSDPDLQAGRLIPSFARSPYPGAYNPYHFFTPEDYFDVTKTAAGLSPVAPNFTTNLILAGILGAPTNAEPRWGADATFYSSEYYNRYTFYRMLAQLGTDSAPELPTKLHLNYVNVDWLGRIVPNMATNFIPWGLPAGTVSVLANGQHYISGGPVQFFTNAAVRLLANAGYTVGIGPTNLVYTNTLTGALQLHIRIWPTNFYTPSVHRLLQLAANIHDATTTNLLLGPQLPSVFRPIFSRQLLETVGTTVEHNIYIIGYEEATDASMAGLGPEATPVMRDLNSPRDRALLGQNPNDMVYGIPAVVGARKGLPNFNEFSMETTIQVTRKLEFRRPDANPTGPVNQTNQMLLLCISNVFGMEAWNSYQTNYPRGLQVVGAVDAFATVSNELGAVLVSSLVSPSSRTSVPLNTWPGYTANGAFKLPLDPATNNYVMCNATYVQSALPGTIPDSGGWLTNGAIMFQRPTGFPVPHWYLSLRTRARFILVDTSVSPNRIIDYVNLDSMEPPLDITLTALTNGLCEASYMPDGSPGSLWCTNRASRSVFSPPYGVLNQIGISLGSVQPNINAGRWNNAANGVTSTTTDAINFFRAQFGMGSAQQFSKTNIFYAPYEPTRTIFYETSWQANDPLVHYTVGDLVSPAQATNRVEVDMRGLASTVNNLGRVNGRYQPWGSPPGQTYSGNVQDTYNLALKDPLITKSDDWDFPTYKLPNPGWLGRVHRGTPWQTIYLKSIPVDYPHWLQWSGDVQFVTNWGQISPSLVALYRPSLTNVIQWNAITYDALFTHPTNDYYLVDLFTTALDDTMSRGKLSINQSGLAAWSAVLSGVDVLATRYQDVIIEPAGTYLTASPAPLVTLVNAINNVRATNFVGGAFPRLGDILRVPELTVNSPFISHLLTNQLNDAVYERIPQQVLGLLKGGEQPRFVIYAYGQALKPALNSIYTSGAYFGLCTNYQITAETATRTVVRIDGAPYNPRATIESFSVLPPD